MNRYAINSNLSYELKVAKTKRKIEQFVYMYGIENIYVSFSGGKDSTVLAHIAKSLFKNVRLVYCDTPFEFPEIRRFAKSFSGVEVVGSKLPIMEYFNKYGYPVESKRVSDRVYRVRNTKSKKEYDRYMNNVNPDGSVCKFGLSQKNKRYVQAPFKISAKCCDVYKKYPMKKVDGFPMIATMCYESSQRKMNYIKKGCIVSGENAYSTPMAFWNEQDVLRYIKDNNIEICSVYGEVVNEEGVYRTTGEKRTGCVCCPFGVRKDMERFLRLAKTHKKLHDFYVYKVGFKEVLDYMEVDYGHEEDTHAKSIHT